MNTDRLVSGTLIPPGDPGEGRRRRERLQWEDALGWAINETGVIALPGQPSIVYRPGQWGGGDGPPVRHHPCPACGVSLTFVGREAEGEAEQLCSSCREATP